MKWNNKKLLALMILSLGLILLSTNVNATKVMSEKEMTMKSFEVQVKGILSKTSKLKEFKFSDNY